MLESNKKFGEYLEALIKDTFFKYIFIEIEDDGQVVSYRSSGYY